MQEPNTETKKDFTPTPEQIDRFIEECDNGEWFPFDHNELRRDIINAN